MSVRLSGLDCMLKVIQCTEELWDDTKVRLRGEPEYSC